MEEMSYKQVVGARYVPKFYQNSQDPNSSEWESGVAYEPLTNVTYQMNGYCSKKPVPVGIGSPATNPAYWSKTFDYNAAYQGLQDEIDTIMQGNINDNVLDYQKFNDNTKRIINENAYVVFVENGEVPSDSSPNGACALYISKVARKVAMFDTGRRENYINVKNALQNNDIEKLDYLIISHYHADHYGNIDALRTDGYITNDTIVYLPRDTSAVEGWDVVQATVRGKFVNNTVITIDSENPLEFDNFKFDFINCDADTFAHYEDAGNTDGNTYSVGAYVHYGDTIILTCGDMSDDAIDYMSSLNKLTHCDVICCPHHGISTGTNNSIYAATTPMYAVYQLSISSEAIAPFNRRSNINFRSKGVAELNCCDVPAYMTGYGDIIVSMNDNGFSIIPSGKKSISYELQSMSYTIYVDDTYEGEVCGTKDKPCNTIGQAIALASRSMCGTTTINIVGEYNHPEDSIEISSMRGLVIINGTMTGDTYNVTLESALISNTICYINNIHFTKADATAAIRCYRNVILKMTKCKIDGITTSESNNRDGAGVYARDFAKVLLDGCTISNRKCVARLETGGSVNARSLHGTSNNIYILGRYSGGDFVADDASDITYTTLASRDDDTFINSFETSKYSYKYNQPFLVYRNNHSGTESTDVVNMGLTIYNNKFFLVFCADGSVYRFHKGGTNTVSGIDTLHSASQPTAEPNFAISFSGTDLSITYKTRIDIVCM